ncbi:MAG: PTS sugar transporter subunit IIA [Desulfobacteraceae bacterium]|nr:PTS sugar transporter subunit IIA [Desulfobacteraceae bacterium]
MALNLKEVAERLNMPVETVQRWVRQGKIPMYQNRGDYYIRHEMLTRWAEEHQLKVTIPNSSAGQTVQQTMGEGILPAMRRGGFLYHLAGDSKEILFKSAVDLTPNLESAERQQVYEKLLEREHLASTGIGHGIAIPHPRSHPGIGLRLPQITTCFLEHPVPFEAIDHKPVSVLMILLSDSTKQHLSLLSKLSFYLRDRSFRDFLLGAPPAKTLLETVARMEAQAK